MAWKGVCGIYTPVAMRQQVEPVTALGGLLDAISNPCSSKHRGHCTPASGNHGRKHGPRWCSKWTFFFTCPRSDRALSLKTVTQGKDMPCMALHVGHAHGLTCWCTTTSVPPTRCGMSDRSRPCRILTRRLLNTGWFML
jgi:hypothetical protein